MEIKLGGVGLAGTKDLLLRSEEDLIYGDFDQRRHDEEVAVSFRLVDPANKVVTPLRVFLSTDVPEHELLPEARRRLRSALMEALKQI